MIEYYLFRHGATEVTRRQSQLGVIIPYGDTNTYASILPNEEATIRRMGVYLSSQGIDGYFSSPLFRCRQTAEVVESITGRSFTFDERLSEEELEPMDQKSQRLRLFLESIGRDYRALAICTHGANISALINLLTGLPRIDDPLKFPRTGIVIRIAGPHYKEVDFNDS